MKTMRHRSDTRRLGKRALTQDKPRNWGNYYVSQANPHPRQPCRVVVSQVELVVRCRDRTILLIVRQERSVNLLTK